MTSWLVEQRVRAMELRDEYLQHEKDLKFAVSKLPDMPLLGFATNEELQRMKDELGQIENRSYRMRMLASQLSTYSAIMED